MKIRSDSSRQVGAKKNHQESIYNPSSPLSIGRRKKGKKRFKGSYSGAFPTPFGKLPECLKQERRIKRRRWRRKKTKKPKPDFHGNTVLACCGEEDMNAYSSTEDDGYTSIGVIDWSNKYYKEPPDPFPRTTFTIWRWQDGNLKTLYCYSMKRFDSHRYRDSKKIISYIAHTFRDFEVRKIIANHRCGMLLSSQVKGLMPCGTEIISYQFRDMPVAVYWDGETFNIDWTLALDDLGRALKNQTVVFPKRCRLIEYYLADFQQFVAFQDRKGRRQYSYLRTGPYGFVECALVALSVILRLHQRRDCEPDWETLETIVAINRK